MVGWLVALFIRKLCLINGSVNSAPKKKCSNQSVTTEIARLVFFQYISHEAVVGYVSCVIPDLLSQTKGSIFVQSVLPTRYEKKPQTKWLKFQYQYFIISDFRQLTAIALSAIGIVYTFCFLAVFLFYKDTPIVKSSNLTFSVLQLILYLIMTFHLGMTIFEQKKWICFMHNISGGVFVKVHYLNIHCQNKSVAQNIRMKCQDEKKYLFSIERSFFSHSLHLCQWDYYCRLCNPVPQVWIWDISS